MAFPLRLRGLPKAEIQSRVSETAALLGIGDLLGRRPQNLSGGQRQRVAMGRAMVRRPKVFLLDEPLSNLDAQLRAQMRVELASLQRRLGTTTVYVTHDQTEAMTLGDRVAILRAGEVQQVGTPREVYARPANLFVASFIGTPTMNLIPGRLDGDRLALPIGDCVLGPDRRRRLGARDGVVVAGLRPECITLADPQGGPSTMDFEAGVALVDWLGAELFVHLDAGPQSLESPPALAALPFALGTGRTRLVARLDPGAAVSEGDRLRIAVAENALHLFDAETGRRLGGAPGESTRTRGDAL
jgi:multiple sugar transport system ATP-binding protein